jgi:hypothetical protein
MAGLSGVVDISMTDGKAQSAYLDLLQRYLGTDVVRMLNPFQQAAGYQKINCFVTGMDISNGLADIKLLLDTEQTSILGAGDIDLKTEGIDFGIQPKPKKGTGIDGLGGISFSLSELTQPFELGGTLARPSFSIDPARATFVAGKFAGAMMLGPFGIAAFFADVSMGKTDVCEVALGKMTEAIEKRKQGGQTPEPEAVESAAGTPSNRKTSGGDR